MGFKKQFRVERFVAALDTLPPSSVRLHLVIEPLISGFKKAVGSIAIFECADVWTEVLIDMFSVFRLAAHPDTRRKVCKYTPRNASCQ